MRPRSRGSRERIEACRLIQLLRHALIRVDVILQPVGLRRRRPVFGGGSMEALKMQNQKNKTGK